MKLKIITVFLACWFVAIAVICTENRFENLARVSCASENDSHIFILRKEEIDPQNRDEDAKFFQRKVMFTLASLDEAGQNESSRILWQNLSSYLANAYPYPEWAASLTCDQKSKKIFLVLANSSVSYLHLDIFFALLNESIALAPSSDIDLPWTPKYLHSGVARFETRLKFEGGGVGSIESNVIGDNKIAVQVNYKSKYVESFTVEIDLDSGTVIKKSIEEQCDQIVREADYSD